MSSYTKSPRNRMDKNKEDKQQELVQVHKTKSATSSENDYANSEDNTDNAVTRFDEECNKIHSPSVDISIDGDTQINSKILKLIETEIKRDTNKRAHFTDSRPQSLSFYEDEKLPEELSGNLEMLSPEERKHYKKRKEYMQLNDDKTSITSELYIGKEPEDLFNNTLKRYKYKKKRHIDTETGMGDSREIMIPKEKQKRKKKRRENSPVGSTNGKRKHRKKDEEYEPRNEITIALEELQDDVFDCTQDEFGGKFEKPKKSPRRSDRVYVQKKNKFECIVNNIKPDEDEQQSSKEITYHPLEIAIVFQSWWIKISNICHGLLGGLALGHWLYLISSFEDHENVLTNYAYYSNLFVGLYYALCVVCIISLLDRIDFDHYGYGSISSIVKRRRHLAILVIYLTCLIVHLSTAILDYKISMLADNNPSSNSSSVNITTIEIRTWNYLSIWRAVFAFSAWIFIGMGPSDNMLYINLKEMEKYLPER